MVDNQIFHHLLALKVIASPFHARDLPKVIRFHLWLAMRSFHIFRPRHLKELHLVVEES